jgi:putative tricarboxylic transport membrane protein
VKPHHHNHGPLALGEVVGRQWFRPDEAGKTMRRRPLRMLVVLVLLALSGCGFAAPDDQLRMMIPNSPGGGYDVTARTAVKITEAAGITGRVQVFNVIGGGGSLAMTRLMNETGNPELLMMMGLGVIGATLTNDSARVTGATPIARLLEEPEGVMVPANSPYRTVQELMAAWRAHPERFDVGGGSLPGGPDHLLTMRISAAVGITDDQVHYVTHDGGGELLPALLGEEIDFAVSGVREYAEQIRSGQIRVLAVSGGGRLPQVDAPTLTEAGIDVVFSNWRGVIAPPGITDEERLAFIDDFAQMRQTPGWQAELQRNGWADAFLPGDDFGRFLVEQDREVETALRQLGLA